MKHILKETIGNITQEIIIDECKIDNDHEQVHIELNNYEDDNLTLTASFIFSEKKKFHNFIGTLLHVQSKMKLS